MKNILLVGGAGSIGDSKLLRDVFSKYQIEAVMHFAAFCYVGESVTDPAKYYRNMANKAANLILGMALVIQSKKWSRLLEVSLGIRSR